MIMMKNMELSELNNVKYGLMSGVFLCGEIRIH